jgi:hypothetical protein
MTENPDVRYLLGEMSVYKNLELCKQRLADQEKFLGVWEKTLRILDLEEGDETQVEAVKIVKDICLSFWNEKSRVGAERWVFFGSKNWLGRSKKGTR